MGSDQKRFLVTDVNARSPFTEAFRTLRTNIDFAGLDNPYRAILMTSAGPGDGKSTNVANLGVVMAQAGKKVLIMDCDLRRPTQHKIFHTDDLMGLTSVLVNDMDPSEVAQETKVPGLYLLPSGPIPPNPAELVGSQRMSTVISRAKEHFDCVLVDSPPILMVTDATLLSTVVDGVVLVLKRGSTRIDAAKDAQDKLDKVGAKILGVILNKVDMTGDDYYYQYYSYYHQGKAEKTKKKKSGSKVAFSQV